MIHHLHNRRLAQRTESPLSEVQRNQLTTHYRASTELLLHSWQADQQDNEEFSPNDCRQSPDYSGWQSPENGPRILRIILGGRYVCEDIIAHPPRIASVYTQAILIGEESFAKQEKTEDSQNYSDP